MLRGLGPRKLAFLAIVTHLRVRNQGDFFALLAPYIETTAAKC